MASPAGDRRCPRCRSRTAQLARTCALCGAALPEERELGGVAVLVVAALMASLSLMAMRGHLAGSADRQLTSSPAPPTRVAYVVGPTDDVGRASMQPAPTASPTPMPSPTPSPDPTAPPAATATEAPPEEEPEPLFSLYQVQDGDCLLAVAQDHGVELETLLALNPELHADALLQVGQTIRVPATETPSAAELTEAVPSAPTDTPTPELEPTATATTPPLVPLSSEPGCFLLVNRGAERVWVTVFSRQVAWRDGISLDSGGNWRYCLLPGPYGYEIAVEGESEPRTGTFDVRGGEDEEWVVNSDA